MGTPRSHHPGSPSPDPVPARHFLVDVGEPIGYFTECSGLSMEYDVLEHVEGGVNDFVHKLRGRMKFPNLVLKRGITHEETFVNWFLACREKTARRDLSVTLLGPDLFLTPSHVGSMSTLPPDRSMHDVDDRLVHRAYQLGVDDPRESSGQPSILALFFAERVGEGLLQRSVNDALERDSRFGAHQRSAHVRGERLTNLGRKRPRKVQSEAAPNSGGDPVQRTLVRLPPLARRLEQKCERVPVQARLEEPVVSAHALAMVGPEKRSDLVDDGFVGAPVRPGLGVAAPQNGDRDEADRGARTQTVLRALED